MRSIFSNRNVIMLSLMLGILVTIFAGCRSFIGRYEEALFYEGEDHRYFENLIDDFCEKDDPCKKFGDNFTYKLAKNEDLQVRDSSMNFKNDCLEAQLLLRFVWFSDVQLRQQEVKLFSEKTSRNADDIIPSFEHHQVQEDFDWAVYLFLIVATNCLHQDHRVDFMIHTGDAIDAGTIEELYQFLYITDKLRVPWLNLVGNHDVSIFGNYKEHLSYTRQAAVNFYPVGNLTNFLWMHRRERFISGFGRHLLPTPSTLGHSPSEDGNERIPGTYCHGFDLDVVMDTDITSRRNFDCSKTPGYYAFDITSDEPPIRVIVLNSARLESWGADGEIDKKQRKWLKKMVDSAKGQLILVFSHHRPDDFDDETLAILSSRSNGSLVFFSGHTHKHHLKLHKGQGGQYFYELNTGSILEYPQIGRLIEIRRISGQTGCLISRALWNTYLDLDQNTDREELGNTVNACEENRDNYRKSPSKAVRCGHSGALIDYLKNKKRPWGRPQPFEEAWSATNVIIPVTLGNEEVNNEQHND